MSKSKKAKLQELSKSISERRGVPSRWVSTVNGRAAILSDTLVRSRQASYWCIRNVVFYSPKTVNMSRRPFFSIGSAWTKPLRRISWDITLWRSVDCFSSTTGTAQKWFNWNLLWFFLWSQACLHTGEDLPSSPEQSSFVICILSSSASDMSATSILLARHFTIYLSLSQQVALNVHVKRLLDN